MGIGSIFRGGARRAAQEFDLGDSRLRRSLMERMEAAQGGPRAVGISQLGQEAGFNTPALDSGIAAGAGIAGLLGTTQLSSRDATGRDVRDATRAQRRELRRLRQELRALERQRRFQDAHQDGYLDGLSINEAELWREVQDMNDTVAQDRPYRRGR